MEITNIDGNHVVGTPATTGKCKIIFTGVGNKLIFGEKVNLNGVEIIFRGSNSVIEFGSFSRLRGVFAVENNCQIIVGSRTKFSKACRVYAAEKMSIVIGSRCLFANVKLKTSDSYSVISLDTGERINLASSVIVGDSVWISENASIDKGVNIGSGSIIGAGSVVIDNVPENCLAVGVPAKVVKTNVTWNEKLI